MSDSERRLVERPGALPPRELSRRPGRANAFDQVDPAALPPATWRQEIRAASGGNLIAALWLLVSAFLLPYEPGDPRWQDVSLGVVIGSLALIKLTRRPWGSGLSWLNFALGGWLIASAFLLAESGYARWNEGLTGMFVFLLAALGGGASDSAKRAAKR